MKISVITPLYKGEKYIDRLLYMVYKGYIKTTESIADIQVEYILINDSPDIDMNMNSHIDKFNDIYMNVSLSENFNIIYAVNHVNSGIHKTRAAGLDLSGGEYIMFLDQDDLISDNIFLKFLQAIKKSKADIVVSNGYRRWKDGADSYVYIPLYQKNAALRLTAYEKIYLYGTDMIFSPGQCLIKRTSIPREWIDNILTDNGCDDCYLWLLMLNNKCSIYTIKDRLYCHIENDTNYSNSYNAMESSFYNMCDMLDKNKNYSRQKTEILRRRYRLKSYIKTQNNFFKKLIRLCCNPDIVMATFIYKLSGYH